MEGTLLGALMNVHIDSPLQKSYDPKVMDEYLGRAKQYAEGVLGGGITVRPEPGSKPETVGNKEWYGVGGAKNPRTNQREPERAIPLNPNVGQQFNEHHALAHLLRSEGMNLDRKAGRTPTSNRWPRGYAGGWAEPDEHGNMHAVLDYSSVYQSRKNAIKAASARGERVVFDAKNIDEINVRSAMQELESRKAQK